jgi:paraquat-inducible protein B
MVVDPSDVSIRTPVLFKIDTSRLRDGSGTKITDGKTLPTMQILIDRGLRARLELQSLVTGQLVVALNFYPGTPIRLMGMSKHYPEMPTIPSTFDTLTKTLENIPLDTLVAQTTRTMQAVERLATAPELASALGKLDRVLSDFDGVVRDVRAQIDPLITSVQGTAAATQATMAQAERTLTDVRAAVAHLTPAATDTLTEYQALARDARQAVARADAQITAVSASLQTTLATANGVLGEDSPVRYDLANALQEMSKAARSLRTLADYLDRHPDALLMGKRREPAQ